VVQTFLAKGGGCQGIGESLGVDYPLRNQEGNVRCHSARREANLGLRLGGEGTGGRVKCLKKEEHTQDLKCRKNKHETRQSAGIAWEPLLGPRRALVPEGKKKRHVLPRWKNYSAQRDPLRWSRRRNNDSAELATKKKGPSEDYRLPRGKKNTSRKALRGGGFP